MPMAKTSFQAASRTACRLKHHCAERRIRRLFAEQGSDRVRRKRGKIERVLVAVPGRGKRRRGAVLREKNELFGRGIPDGEFHALDPDRAVCDRNAEGFSGFGVKTWENVRPMERKHANGKRRATEGVGDPTDPQILVFRDDPDPESHAEDRPIPAARGFHDRTRDAGRLHVLGGGNGVVVGERTGVLWQILNCVDRFPAAGDEIVR